MQECALKIVRFHTSHAALQPCAFDVSIFEKLFILHITVGLTILR